MTTTDARVLEGQWLGSGLGFLEGPVLTNAGTLIVSSISLGEIWEFQPDGSGAKILEAEGGVNGLTIGLGGRLFGTHIWHTHPVPEWKKSTGGIVTWNSGVLEFVSRDPISPNDLCFGPDGFIYFTDPTRERPGWDDGRLFRLDSSGDHPAELLTSVPWFPNGIGFGPNPNELFVADSGGARILVFDVTEAGLENQRVFAQISGGVPDGFAFDVEGNLLVCCPVIDGSDRPSTLQVWSPDGKLLDVSVPNPESTHTTNVLLTGDGTLYITDADRGSVLKIEDWAGPVGAPLYPARGAEVAA